MTVPNNNYQLVNMSPPKITGGCSGINIYGGAFTMIDKQAFVDMVKNIGQAALSQAFYMAIDSLTPMVGANLKNLSDQMNKANWNNINTCELGKATANFAAGGPAKMYESAKAAVVQLAPGNNQATDATDAKANITTPDQVADNMRQLESAGKIKVLKGNLVYEALKEYGSLTTEEIELFQSFTGTMIYVDKPMDFRYIPPTITDFKLLIGNDKYATKVGQVPVISCTTAAGADNKINQFCDNADVVGKDVNQKPFLAEVYNKLNTLAAKLKANDAALPADLVAFINATPVPVYKMLSVATGMKGTGIADAMIDKYSDLIAAEYARAYIEHAYKVVFESIDRKTQDFSDPQKEAFEHMRRDRQLVMARMISELNEVYTSAMALNGLAQDIQHMEKVLNSNMPSMINDSMKWQRAQMGGA